MSVQNGLFTSEAVSSGHPDKLCDRISDAILDAFLNVDPDARVACESFAADKKVIVAGEFRAKEHVAADVERQAEDIVRTAIREVGYGNAAFDIDPDTCDVEIRFNSQASEIAAGVDGGPELGAGDQGIMFGYATNETEELMPLAWSLANDLIARGSKIFAGGSSPLRPDAKSQVTLRYENGVPVGVQTIVLSWQHDPHVSLGAIRAYLLSEIIDTVIPVGRRTTDCRLHLNPSGTFTTGGPKGDTGLTGRKIIVDTYGGAAPHGGGAFSGKDPSKVDRSGAYAARWVAKNLVGAGLADRATVQLAYAIGVAQPVSVNVNTQGSGRFDDRHLADAVSQVFDLSTGGIIRDLDLKRPIYASTSSLGHFGRHRDQDMHRWERLDRVSELRSALRGTEV
ncbi:methionine adenosyltransferase [Sphingomonas sp. LY160]|uniref:methionine adenosyltransferase n=1 Tax=Sphingomonas sp. LY160 TaxID=3095342 RepID=UPI002ADECDB6|nr:methionine adenosyltransferase [Sphingomonas sp. LY160]MEA1071770.1 methionine adenosyltransferase [Sphingomonas sp. LY160]